MLPPPEKYQPTNTLTKRDFVSFPDTLKLYYTLQNTCIQDTHSARNTLISSVWDVLRRYTCVHFPNSYGSLNISSGGLTRRVICQTFWGKLVAGCNGIWCSASNMLPPPEKYQPTNTLTKRGFVSFPDNFEAVLYITKYLYTRHTQCSKHSYIECLGRPQTIHMPPFSE